MYLLHDGVVVLTCSCTLHSKGCGVARFCSVDHQKMANRNTKVLWEERHKDICGLLKKWKQVEKGHVAADLCIPDMLAFLGL